MNRTSLFHLAVIFVLASPMVLKAQAADAQKPSTELTVEKMKNGYVLAPDYKFTEVDGDFANLVGGYGGKLIDDTLLIGGGGYWLANGSDTRKMGYGGVLAEYTVKPTRFMSLSARGLVGLGTTTLGVEVAVPGGDRFGTRDFGRSDDRRPSTTVRRVFRFRDDFVLAEPQGNVVFNVSRWLRLGLGASYRFVGATSFGDRLGGVSGNFSVVLGSF